MNWSCVQALHEVQGDRRIDQEPKKPCADEIPKGNRYEESDRPPICSQPFPRVRHPNVFPCFETNQHQRNDFQRAEYCSQRKYPSRHSRKVKVMKRTDDAAGKENHCREENGSRGCSDRKQLESCKEERNHDSCKHFEESLYPEMDHPPT